MSLEAWGTHVFDDLRRLPITVVSISAASLHLCFTASFGPHQLWLTLNPPWQLERGEEILLRYGPRHEAEGTTDPVYSRIGWQEEHSLLQHSNIVDIRHHDATGEIVLTFSNGLIACTTPDPDASPGDPKWEVRQSPYFLQRQADGGYCS